MLADSFTTIWSDRIQDVVSFFSMFVEARFELQFGVDFGDSSMG